MRQLFFAVLLVLLVTACSKSFLEKTPINQKVESDFYKTPGDAFEALVAAYSVLNYDGHGNIWLSSEIASDNCFGGGGTSDNGLRQWDNFQSYLDHNAAAWKKYYTGIYRTNMFLKKIDGVNFGGDAALKDQYTGEARFLRAYFYFDLVRMFGKVPLLTAPIEGTNFNVSQSTPDSVYALIASDLKESITLLTASAKKFNQIPAEEYGRVTKWAAEALLARVYLYYTGYYTKNDLAGIVTKQEAINAAEDVIQNSGYDLVDKFPSLFRASAGSSFAGQNNKEGVFVIQYTDKGLGNWNQQNGNRVQVMVGIRNQVLDPYYKGWGIAPVNGKLWNAYETGDARRSATIISIVDENLPFNTATTDQAQYTGYYWKKYTPMGGADRPDANGGDFQIDNFDNYAVIRFADVLLMGAELNLSSNLAKAQGYYDRVRDRAFNSTTRRNTLTNDANGLQLIMTERWLELALEGHRYWDLLRQGLTTAKQAIDNNTGNEFNVSFRTETKGLFEIPQTQIGLSNGTITQNGGW
ncbi:RagB/SusD family nutrient uptake outer membrane protein [Longitalea arenae]|uniref:RagB/SusD family nutrient uptake outer membrane protein n=1 Tax=Longitalea arenae TaxID=2812558 RepID=UPI0019683B31|nr:RagB/SusD family nutrient uptake outer membrane protein [Longitalea arenae]